MEKRLDLFIPLGTAAKNLPIPEKFTYPFHYKPDPLAKEAARDFQGRFMGEIEKQHRFWAETSVGTGKMIGVLVVKTQESELGYIAAFSGKLTSGNHIYPFVPPVYDMLNETGFYKQEEARLSELNKQIEQLEASQERQAHIDDLERVRNERAKQTASAKENIEKQRRIRVQQRHALNNSGMQAHDVMAAMLKLDEVSKKEQIDLKKLKRIWRDHEEASLAKLKTFEAQISALKYERKTGSADLQSRLFKEYTFLNIHGQRKNLLDIFGLSQEQQPPSGAGECAAPKLLQYAFLQGWQPICMAEFWWGESPKSEIRQHGAFYPACRSKCKPILYHMLKGLDTDPDPLMKVNERLSIFPLIYEDNDILAVNKPPGLLSVPGKNNLPSVFTILQEKYPEEKLFMVHRLDMSTSGIILVARNIKAYHHLQKQFASRQIKKTYVALLSGFVKGASGEINLPLRVDLEDRPRQLVCYEHGLEARTQWKVSGKHHTGSRVYFYPITGRTHQLRVHAAHPNGLGYPILGDDLYGQREDRLYLHAESIAFEHPTTGLFLRLSARSKF